MSAWPELKEKLLRPVHEVFENRARNALARSGMLFIGQIYLVRYPLIRIENMGIKSYAEVMSHLESTGLNTTLPAPTANIPDGGLADPDKFPQSYWMHTDVRKPTPGYTHDGYGNYKPTQATISAYFKSEDFQNERLKFERFLEDNSEYFQRVAMPEGQAEYEPPEPVAIEGGVKKETSELAHYPSTYDWILQKLPSELREGLNAEFLNAVLNSPDVRARVQEVVSRAVVEKLGLEAASTKTHSTPSGPGPE